MPKDPACATCPYRKIRPDARSTWTLGTTIWKGQKKEADPRPYECERLGMIMTLADTQWFFCAHHPHFLVPPSLRDQ